MDFRTTRLRLLACAVGASLLVAAMPVVAQAQTRVLRAVGVPEMGPNLHCGTPIWTLNGIPAGAESHGSFIGLLYNQVFGTPAPTQRILQADCDGTTGRLDEPVLTSYDDQYGLARGWTTPDPLLEGLTLNQIPVPAGQGVRAPIPFPGSVPPNPLPPTRRIAAEDASLAGWLSVGGDLEITCDDATNTAVVAAGMYNLIPDGVYTMWAHWAEATATVLVAPFGGLPNTIVADENGTAEFCRSLEYCPLDLAPDSSEIQFLSLSYMGDGISYGLHPYEAFSTRAFLGIGPLPFASTIPGGIVSFDHLGFRINATGGPDPGPIMPALCRDNTATVAAFPFGPVGLICALVLMGARAISRRGRAPAQLSSGLPLAQDPTDQGA